MRMKAAVLGHFGEGVTLLNGQTVKTKIVTKELQNRLGQDEVLTIDTHGGAKTLLKAPFQVFRALKNSKNVLIFPAHNGLRVYAPLLNVQKHFFKGRKIHYVVIGGWLPEFLKTRKGLAKILKKFDGIYVETNTMRKSLEAQGFDNVFVMPNCKKLTVLAEDELVYPTEEPYKLCTFSRVMKEKGIEDAIEAVKAINTQYGKTVYTLDIYGQVDGAQIEWFEDLQKNFPEFVRYGGLIPFDKSVEILKDYFVLLFPTRFYTEGIPGTIIDAYAAGVPVVSAKWESFADIVDEGVTGLGYEFGCPNDLTEKLSYMAEHTEAFRALKPGCLEKSKQFLPDEAIKVMLGRFA